MPVTLIKVYESKNNEGVQESEHLSRSKALSPKQKHTLVKKKESAKCKA
jgi:hypothetical protein